MGNNGQIDLKTCFRGITAIINRIHWQQSCQCKAAAGGYPPASVPCSGACPWPVQAVEDLEGLSPKFSPNLPVESKAEVLVEDPRTKASVEAWSANRRPKCVSKQEALVEVGILDVDPTVDCKCQEHNSISKSLFRRSYLTCKIEYSRRTCQCKVEYSHLKNWVFWLSWFQLTGL